MSKYKNLEHITVTYDDIECEVVFDVDGEMLDIAIGGIYCGHHMTQDFSDKVEELAREQMDSDEPLDFDDWRDYE